MKKLFTLLVVIFVLLIGCAGLNLNKSDLRTVEFGPISYTIPSTVPDFAPWSGEVDPMFISEKFAVVRWVGVNPKNADEAVILLIAGENSDKEDGQPYIMVIVHTQSIKLSKRSFYVDKEYLQTGKPSFTLSFVAEPPDIENFITMKKQQFARKVEI